MINRTLIPQIGRVLRVQNKLPPSYFEEAIFVMGKTKNMLEEKTEQLNSLLILKPEKTDYLFSSMEKLDEKFRELADHFLKKVTFDEGNRKMEGN